LPGLGRGGVDREGAVGGVVGVVGGVNDGNLDKMPDETCVITWCGAVDYRAFWNVLACANYGESPEVGFAGFYFAPEFN